MLNRKVNWLRLVAYGMMATMFLIALLFILSWFRRVDKDVKGVNLPNIEYYQDYEGKG